MAADGGADMTAEREPETQAGSEGLMHCARHPQVETALTCGRCGTPICPRCLVQTPVGARCPTCANVRRLPTVDIKPVFLARGFAAAVVAGVAVGVATNRKRGPALQACAVVGVVLAYLVHNVVAGIPVLPAGDFWGYVATGLAAVFAAQRLQR